MGRTGLMVWTFVLYWTWPSFSTWESSEGGDFESWHRHRSSAMPTPSPSRWQESCLEDEEIFWWIWVSAQRRAWSSHSKLRKSSCLPWNFCPANWSDSVANGRVRSRTILPVVLTHPLTLWSCLSSPMQIVFMHSCSRPYSTCRVLPPCCSF